MFDFKKPDIFHSDFYLKILKKESEFEMTIWNVLFR